MNNETAVAMFDSNPKSLSQYQGLAGAGLDNVTQEDIGLPFLNIIQKGSAEFDETHPDHAQKAIEGVKPGCIINTATRQILYSPKGKGIHIVPCLYQKVFNEWRPKPQGGGLIKVHTNPSILQRTLRTEKGADIISEGEGVGNEIKTTMTFFVLCHTPETGWFEAILNLTGKGLAVGRKWLAAAMTKRGPNGALLPLFVHGYRVETIPQSNQKGSWFQWDVQLAGAVKQQEVLDKAHAFYTEALRQTRRIAPATAADNAESLAGTDDQV